MVVRPNFDLYESVTSGNLSLKIAEKGKFKNASSVELILDAAEKVFAERGFSGTSMRKIVAEAGVANGAIHYHFKTKEDLFRRVIKRRSEQISKERNCQLENCRIGEDRPPLLEQIIYAYILPIISPDLGSIEVRYRFARLRSRVISEYNWPDISPFSETTSQSDLRFVDSIAADQAHLPRWEVRLRFKIMWCTIHEMAAGLSRAALDETIRMENVHPLIEFEEQLPWLVTILAMMFRAPAGANDGFSVFLDRMREGKNSIT